MTLSALSTSTYQSKSLNAKIITIELGIILNSNFQSNKPTTHVHVCHLALLLSVALKANSMVQCVLCHSESIYEAIWKVNLFFSL